MTTPTERDREPMLVGIADAALDAIDTLTVDVGELSDGGYSDIRCTITGFDQQAGGEERMRNNDPSQTYITKDTLKMHLRIDNMDELDVTDDHTIQFITLPKVTVGSDGRQRRAKPTKTSAYGIWLAAMEGQGISANPEVATTYQIRNLGDLTGLQYHRVIQHFESFDGSTYPVAVPFEVYGFDNEVREQAGLPPAYFKGQEPAAPAAKAKAS